MVVKGLPVCLSLTIEMTGCENVAKDLVYESFGKVALSKK